MPRVEKRSDDHKEGVNVWRYSWACLGGAQGLPSKAGAAFLPA